MREPVRITIYNHKGGVGKTTLTANIAFALSSLGKSVLLVDSDPQCNLTSYLLADDVVDDLLQHSNDDDGQTIWSAVRPVLASTGSVQLVRPVSVGDVALLPGDIQLSEFEEYLGDAWADGFRRRIGALQATSSISYLVSNLHKEANGGYDFVFYDTGPNIGPLNRVLLLDSDFFIVPVACDLFSMRALGTLGRTLKGWMKDAETVEAIGPDGGMFLKGRPTFLGYIPQRFKVYGQEMTLESKSYHRKIRERVYGDISSVLRTIDVGLAPKKSVDPIVGKVRDHTRAVQEAQRQGVPIWKCNIPASYRDQKDAAKSSFLEIAKNIMTSVHMA